MHHTTGNCDVSVTHLCGFDRHGEMIRLISLGSMMFSVHLMQARHRADDEVNHRPTQVSKEGNYRVSESLPELSIIKFAHDIKIVMSSKSVMSRIVTCK